MNSFYLRKRPIVYGRIIYIWLAIYDHQLYEEGGAG